MGARASRRGVGASILVILAVCAALLEPSGATAVATAKPKIASISPAHGSELGGTVVTLRGKRLAHVKRVYFGAHKGTHLVHHSGRRITVRTPARSHPGVVKVKVRTGSRTYKVGHFRYTLAPPAVTGLNRHQGPLVGGTRVTVHGRNFSGVRTVRFGDLKGRSVHVTSTTSLTVIAPTAWPTTVQVRVTTPAGTSPRTPRARFKYVSPAPRSTSKIVTAGGVLTPRKGVVTAVKGGKATANAKGSTTTAYTVTLGAAAATVPKKGQGFYLPPGQKVFPTGLAGTVSWVKKQDDGSHNIGVIPDLTTPLDRLSIHYAGALDTSGRVQARGARVPGSLDFGSISAGALECTANDGSGKKVSVSGSLSLTIKNVHPVVNVDRGGWFHKPFIQAYVSYDTTLSASISAGTGAACKLNAAWVNQHTKVFYLGDTGATISIGPDVEVKISAEGALSFSQTSYHTIGFETTSSGGIKPLDGKSSDPPKVEASGGLSMDAFAGADVQLGALNVIGVGLSLGGGVKGEAKIKSSTEHPAPQVCVSITPFLRGSLYAYLNVWVKEWKLKAFTADLDLHVFEKCIAAGDAPSTWKALKLSLPPGASSSSYPVPSMGCSTVSCAVSAEDTVAGGTGLALWRGHGRSWVRSAATLPSGASSLSSNSSNDLGCTATVCITDGGYVDAAYGGSRAAFWMLANDKWTVAKAPLPIDADEYDPQVWTGGVSCSSSMCAVGGSYTDEWGDQHAAVWTLRGGSWTVSVLTMPDDADQASITEDGITAQVGCGTNVCVAATNYWAYGNVWKTALSSWSDGSWTTTEAPYPADTRDETFTETGGPACIKTRCLVPAEYTDIDEQVHPTVWTWANGGWSVEQLPAPTTSYVEPGRAECSSSTCVVEEDFGRANVWTGAPGNWTRYVLPVPAGAGKGEGGESFTGACKSDQCAVVGSYLDSANHRQGALWLGIGKQWRVAQTPLPADAKWQQAVVGSGIAYFKDSPVAVGAYTATDGRQHVVVWTPRG